MDSIIQLLLQSHNTLARVVVVLWIIDHGLAMAPNSVTRASNTVQLILVGLLKLKRTLRGKEKDCQSIKDQKKLSRSSRRLPAKKRKL